MDVWLCLASRQNIIKRTPAPAGREREGGGREAREGGVHRCRQNVKKRTRAQAGRDRERETVGGGRISTFHRVIDRRLQNNIGVSRVLPKYYNSVAYM